MFNSKVIVAAAVVGFLLSFFTGLFSGVGFGFVLLRAVIFAAVLALLAAGIMFVFDKFLDMDSVETTSYPTEVNVGSMVDVTVGDDELPEEDSAPGFYVDAKLTSNGAGSNSSVSPVTNVVLNANSSVEQGSALGDLETVTEQKANVTSPKETVTPTSSSNVQESGFVKSDVQTITSSANYSNYSDGNSPEDLDELPEFNSNENKSSSFGGASLSDNSPLMDKGPQDAELMAQAIRTLLNKDG